MVDCMNAKLISLIRYRISLKDYLIDLTIYFAWVSEMHSLFIIKHVKAEDRTRMNKKKILLFLKHKITIKFFFIQKNLS